jgi:serine protease Do
MLKKIVISSIVASGLFANSIVLNNVKTTPKRVDLSKINTIGSYNNSIKSAVKSIVNISTKQRFRSIDNSLEQIFDDPFFKQFFNVNFVHQTNQKQSLGSGVVISKDGYIVTNTHLIKNASEILVSFNQNSKQYEAKIVGVDPSNDIAILKINASNLKAIKIANADDLLQGDLVFTIGNPYAISTIVSKGIISVVNHNSNKSMQYDNFIQTDAKVNSLNSGGALINSAGALIGINHSSNNGMGFVTPINVVKKIIKNITLNGKLIKGYLNIDVQNINTNLKKMYNNKNGVLVLDTHNLSFDIKRGDLIYKINGKLIHNKKEFHNIIDNLQYNQKIKIQLERDKQNITTTIIVDKKDQLSVNTPVLNGLYVTPLNSLNMKKFRIKQNIKGLLINDIIPQSQAEKLGFEIGDIIVQVENIETTNLTSLQKAIKNYNHKEKRVYINRYGKIFIVLVK